jgi:hypothetical protein
MRSASLLEDGIYPENSHYRWIRIGGARQDGVLQARHDATTDLNTTIVEPRIGIGGLSSLNNGPWAGRIDEIKFHNRARSAEEIQKLIEQDGGLP